MHRSLHNRAQVRGAFTLVELLVVIGIIALLIGILLPALNRARRQAYQTQCQSNMRQIALGMLTYINDNQGHLMIGWIDNGAYPQYPDGWGWAGELMFQGYVRSENYYTNPNDKSSTPKTQTHTNTIFRCPEDVDTSIGTSQGEYPTDEANNHFSINLAGNTPRADGQPLHAVATSYGLNIHNDPGTTDRCPFVWFSRTGSGQPTADFRTDGRTMAMIRRSAFTIMLVEDGGTNNPWGATNGSYKVNGVEYSVTRIAARHGKPFNFATGGPIPATGSDAWTNFAFFDGHVGMYPTWPLFSKNYSHGSGPFDWVGDPTVALNPKEQE